jgi:hypothetical protein
LAQTDTHDTMMGMQMAAIPEVLTRAVAAVRAGDAQALRHLIDWPMTGAAKTLCSLASTPEGERAENVAAGLAELDRASTDPLQVTNILAVQAGVLGEATNIRAALPWQQREVLATLRVPPMPPGLSADQLARVDALRARSELITDVYVVITATAQRPYAIAADTGLLVLVLD